MMNEEHFECPKCETWRTVESIGTVVVALCPVCKQPMRKVVEQQTSLNLDR